MSPSNYRRAIHFYLTTKYGWGNRKAKAWIGNNSEYLNKMHEAHCPAVQTARYITRMRDNGYGLLR
jgi:hypothetical protein